MSQDQDYGLSQELATRPLAPPTLDYLPPRPTADHPIGLIGCGAVTAFHLAAYRRAGFRVVALCDASLERAQQRQQEFFPEAAITVDYHELLRRQDVEVVDVATPPQPRPAIIEAALDAGKHVLSQKPFALDLDVAGRLIKRADQRDRLLAVNQNGRWAPYFRYMLEAIRAGCIGRIHSADFVMHFDHNWTAGTHFDQLHHLLLFDFAVHFFDLACCCFAGEKPLGVFSKLQSSASQKSIPPLLATSVATFEKGMATFLFGGDTRTGQQDQTVVVGSSGTLRSVGPGLNRKNVSLHTAEGVGSIDPEGTWFEQGFEGTMSELLCAIEQNREPFHSARNNLATLALTFAAVASADSGREEVPGEVRSVVV